MSLRSTRIVKATNLHDPWSNNIRVIRVLSKSVVILSGYINMKLKTHNIAAKRIRITHKGKMIKRIAGQDHFNARESGKITSKKRRDEMVAKSDISTIKQLIPYR